MSHRLTLVAAVSLAALAGCAAPVALAPPEPAPPAVRAVAWRTVPSEAYKGKRDDIHFPTAQTGFYGTGAGDLFRSDDGGETWRKLWHRKGTFIRALGFIDTQTGFLGNVGDYYPGVTDQTPLYRTRDGGLSWSPVDLGGVTVKGVCAIDILKTRSIYQGELRDRVIVHAAGRVGGPAWLLRSVDGGETFRVIDMSAHAGAILDVKFLDSETGFIFASTSKDVREAEALILKTTDGGASWRAVYRSGRKMELSWKGSFADSRTGFATVQTYDPERAQQVIAKTEDGGETWRELPLVTDPKARQFGIGFASPLQGWVGTAAGGFETRDGGLSWTAVPIAKAANKIRVRAGDGTPKLVAIGTEVQLGD